MDVKTRPSQPPVYGMVVKVIRRGDLEAKVFVPALGRTFSVPPRCLVKSIEHQGREFLLVDLANDQPSHLNEVAIRDAGPVREWYPCYAKDVQSLAGCIDRAGVSA